MGNTWHIQDVASLHHVLQDVDVSVSGRAAGRTTEQTERFSVARLLATIVSGLKYPFTLDHGDRPDFVLSFDALRIGIEHTEIVPENVARASFFREQGNGPDMYFLPHATFGEVPKTNAQIKAEIEQDKPSPGWYGNAPERETASAISGFAQRKCVVAAKPGFRRFDQNWLLMYNNWPAPAPRLAEACAIARETMVTEQCFNTFDKVYVVGPRKLATITAFDVQVTALIEPGVEC